MPSPSTVVVSPKGEARALRGHPWIFRSDVLDAGGAQPGAVVRVAGPRGRTLGYAFYSSRSEIRLRLFERGEMLAPTFLRDRLSAALRWRERVAAGATTCRLVHGEGDGLPSLVVDRYGDYLVVQALSQGMDALVPEITAALMETLAPAGILARHDPKVRLLEGLDQHVKELAGAVPHSVTVREGPVEYDVDVWSGQKTGLFLDQRENREAAARYARGRLLDGFSYHGGFALRLAPRCASAEAVDISADAVARILANAARNGITLEAREANVFDELRRLERAGERYDTIVLDPPAFAKNKASVAGAVSGYKEINLRAMHLLNPGGHLVTCSCSYNIDEATFSDILHAASADSRTPMTVVEKRTQGRDHPVLLGVPETYYLKCFILRRVE
jgi:23S rRNA (cytosine1962-C5)-methyltransferase